MITKVLNLNQYENVIAFNQSAAQMDYDIDICHGRYVLNAKSLMGLFSLDLSQPQTIQIHATADEAAGFLEAISSMIIG